MDKLAEFFAGLASARAFEDVRHGDRRMQATARAWTRRYYRTSSGYVGQPLPPWRVQEFSEDKSGLQRLQGETLRILRDLIDGKDVEPQEWQLPQHPVWKLNGWELATRFYSPDPKAAIFSDLYNLVMRKPFPFGRCPHCGRFFIRHGRQKECGICPEGRAAHKDERRKYMKDHMRRIRAREKAAREKARRS